MVNNDFRAHILAVDDDSSVRTSLKTIFEETYKFTSASNAQKTLDLLNQLDIQLVILDLGLPDMNGIKLLKKMKEINPMLEVIVLTADTSLQSGIEAMKAGAFDYLVKPFDVDQMSIVAKNALDKVNLIHEVRYRRAKDPGQPKALIGRSKAIQGVFRTVSQLTNNDATVLITGESGVGKELVAQAIHYRSHRKTGPFIPVNCGAIPSELMESELFGHEKGAFTSASYKRIGKFEIAHRGTIFLDEISLLSLGLQAKLLRVLQERTIEPIGSMRQLPVNIRIVAATNADLNKQIKNGQFREDLYYRLNIVPLMMPPLRERKDDIPLLVKHFLDIYNKEYHRQIKQMSPEVMEYFYDYGWPGNVRELENVIQRLLVISTGSSITIDELPLEMINSRAASKLIDQNKTTLEQVLTRFEREYIERALVKANNNRQEAARILGIHRNTLLNRMKALGLIIP